MSEQNLKTAELVIVTSPNGRDNWQALRPEDVPEWVKDPDVMGHLVAGDTVMDPTQGEKGSPWYAAMKPADYLRAIRAEQRRQRRNAKRALH